MERTYKSRVVAHRNGGIYHFLFTHWPERYGYGTQFEIDNWRDNPAGTYTVLTVKHLARSYYLDGTRVND